VLLLGTRGAAALCQGTLPGLPGPRSRRLAIHRSIRARHSAGGAGRVVADHSGPVWHKPPRCRTGA